MRTQAKDFQEVVGIECPVWVENAWRDNENGCHLSHRFCLSHVGRQHNEASSGLHFCNKKKKPKSCMSIRLDCKSYVTFMKCFTAKSGLEFHQLFKDRFKAT